MTETTRRLYDLTSAAINKAAEAILDLTRSQDPRRSPTRLARDLELASAHLEAALELVGDARKAA